MNSGESRENKIKTNVKNKVIKMTLEKMTDTESLTKGVASLQKK